MQRSWLEVKLGSERYQEFDDYIWILVRSHFHRGHEIFECRPLVSSNVVVRIVIRCCQPAGILLCSMENFPKRFKPKLLNWLETRSNARVPEDFVSCSR